MADASSAYQYQYPVNQEYGYNYGPMSYAGGYENSAQYSRQVEQAEREREQMERTRMQIEWESRAIERAERERAEKERDRAEQERQQVEIERQNREIARINRESQRAQRLAAVGSYSMWKREAEPSNYGHGYVSNGYMGVHGYSGIHGFGTGATVGTYTPYGYANSGNYYANSAGVVHVAKREAAADAYVYSPMHYMEQYGYAPRGHTAYAGYFGPRHYYESTGAVHIS